MSSPRRQLFSRMLSNKIKFLDKSLTDKEVQVRIFKITNLLNKNYLIKLNLCEYLGKIIESRNSTTEKGKRRIEKGKRRIKHGLSTAKRQNK